MTREGSPAVRVTIVDDHPMVRAGLRSMLRGSGIDVVAEASTGAEALRVAAEVEADVILLDLRLPDTPGLTVLRRLKTMPSSASVLVITMDDDPALVRRAIAAGAAGYLLKGIGSEELIAAVHAVHNGDSVLDPAVLQAVVSETAQRRAIGDVGAASDAEAADATADAEELTAVELDVLRLIATGVTNKEIGERLHWSVGTVKKYVQRILDKLRVSDRTQAAVIGVRRGLLG